MTDLDYLLEALLECDDIIEAVKLAIERRDMQIQEVVPAGCDPSVYF